MPKRKLSYRRMTLIGEEELSRLRQKQLRDYNPSLAVMANLQQDMSDILGREDVSAEQKVKLLNVMQTRFQRLKDELPHAALTAVAAATPAPPPAVDPPAPVVVADAAAAPAVVVAAPAVAVAPSRKPSKKSHAFERLVWDHPQVISRADTGEVVVYGRRVQGSNYEDLVSMLNDPHSQANLTGLQSFLQALTSIGFKPSDARNPFVGGYIDAYRKSASSHRSPSGTRSRLRGKRQRVGEVSEPQEGQGGFYVLHRGKRPPGKLFKVLRLFR